MAIIEYVVVQPSTSAELRDLVVSSLGIAGAGRGVIDLVLRTRLDVPDAIDEAMAVSIRRIDLSDDGMITRVLGESASSRSVVVTLGAGGVVAGVSLVRV